MQVAHVFQENEAYCGPAVVQMVLASFGITKTQQEIATELETDMVEGTSAKELEAFFVKQGLKVERKNDATWSDLEAALTKGLVIAGYIEQDGDPHYGVVREVGEESVVLADPWRGDNFTLSKQEFLERWVDKETGKYGNHMLLTVLLPQEK